MYAYGKGSGQKITNATAYQLMAMERTRDLDQNTALQLAAIQRYDNRLFGEKRQYSFDPNAGKHAAEAEAGKAGLKDKTRVDNTDILYRAERTARELSEAGYGQSVKEEVSPQNKLHLTTITEQRNYGIEKAISILSEASDKNNAILKELTGTFTDVSNQILSKSGKIDMAGTAAAISAIQKSTGASGLQLNRQTSFVQGLGEESNKLSSIFLMRALKRENPNASFNQIKSMMENPTEHLGAVQSMFGGLS